MDSIQSMDENPTAKFEAKEEMFQQGLTRNSLSPISMVQVSQEFKEEMPPTKIHRNKRKVRTPLRSRRSTPETERENSPNGEDSSLDFADVDLSKLSRSEQSVSENENHDNTAIRKNSFDEFYNALNITRSVMTDYELSSDVSPPNSPLKRKFVRPTRNQLTPSFTHDGITKSTLLNSDMENYVDNDSDSDYDYCFESDDGIKQKNERIKNHIQSHVPSSTTLSNGNAVPRKRRGRPPGKKSTPRLTKKNQASSFSVRTRSTQKGTGMTLLLGKSLRHFVVSY